MTDSKELTAIGNRAPVLTREQVLANRDLVRQVMGGVMEKGKHYGVIPGTGDKPTLLKPGAEVLLSVFRIATSLVVEDLSDDDEVHYRVIVKGMHGPSGIDLGEGIGECSSNETKYKWRRPVCQQEFDDTERTRRRLKWTQPSGKEAQAFPQIRTEPADVANTVLKMAKKRALVDFCLTALAVSDLFSQDEAELAAELRGDAEDPPADPTGGRKPDTNRPQAKGQRNQSGNAGQSAQSGGKTDAKPDAKPAATQVPIADFRRKLDQMGVTEKEMCGHFGIGVLEDLALKDVGRAEEWLETMRKRVAP